MGHCFLDTPYVWGYLIFVYFTCNAPAAMSLLLKINIFSLYFFSSIVPLIFYGRCKLNSFQMWKKLYRHNCCLLSILWAAFSGHSKVGEQIQQGRLWFFFQFCFRNRFYFYRNFLLIFSIFHFILYTAGFSKTLGGFHGTYIRW